MKKIQIIFMLISVIVMSCACTKRAGNELTVSKDIQNKIDDIENTYNISLMYGSDNIEGEISFEFKKLNDAEELEKTLQAMDKIFNRFPDDWAIRIANAEMDMDIIEKVDNVSIVLCEDLGDEKDENGKPYEISANFQVVENTLYLFADVHNFDPKISLTEMIVTRMIEKAVADNEISEIINQQENKDYIRLNVCELFENNNPDDFSYTNKIAEIPDEYKQYLYQTDVQNEEVYFVREEAMYSSYLDCLYTISPLIYTDENEELPEAYESQRVKNKCTLFIINSNYMFDGEFDYWEKWFK